MSEEFNNIETIIKEQKVTRRELEKFRMIVKNYQPNNDSFISLLSQYVDRNIDKKRLTVLEKTIDALFESLEYPTDKLFLDNEQKFIGYNLVKDTIIEYCTTNVNDINIIIDNVAFLNKKSVQEVKKNMQSYMSSYGDSSKVISAFKKYSENYEKNITKSTLPEVYVPIFSKAVSLKIKEIEEIRKNQIDVINHRQTK